MSLRVRPVRRRRARTHAPNIQVGTHTHAPAYLNLRARDTLCIGIGRASGHLTHRTLLWEKVQHRTTLRPIRGRRKRARCSTFVMTARPQIAVSLQDEGGGRRNHARLERGLG
jgi:hypothetical protein